MENAAKRASSAKIAKIFACIGFGALTLELVPFLIELPRPHGSVYGRMQDLFTGIGLLFLMLAFITYAMRRPLDKDGTPHWATTTLVLVIAFPIGILVQLILMYLDIGTQPLPIEVARYFTVPIAILAVPPMILYVILRIVKPSKTVFLYELFIFLGSILPIQQIVANLSVN